MAVLQMRKISICALKKNRKPILEFIQSRGVVEVQDLVGEDEVFQKMDTSVARSAFERNIALAENALEILDKYAPEKTSLLDALNGRKIITWKSHDNIVRIQDRVMKIINMIIRYNQQAVDANAEIVRIQSQMEMLTPWLKLGVPMSYQGTEHTKAQFGILAGNLTQETLYEQMEKANSFPEASDVRIVYSDKNQTYVTAICHKKDEQTFEEALRDIGFAKPMLQISGIPSQVKKDWEKQLQKKELEKAEAEKKIVEISEERATIRLLSDYYRNRTAKYETLGELAQTKHVFLICGFIPERDAVKLRNDLTEQFEVMVELEDVEEEDDVPVALSNNSFSAPVESVVTSFGFPKKGEIDPSFIMSFFYYFLFGLMLSDAAYGFIIFAACAYFVKTKKGMEEGMKKMLSMFMYCGLSTMIWGILFGSYFGDLIPVVAKTFFDAEITVPALWFFPIDEPLRLFIYSMLFGIIHLFFGLGMKGYLLIREKKYVDFVCDVLLWYCLVLGLILLLIPTDIFASIAGAKVVFPPIVSTISIVLAIVGAAGIVLMSGRSSKNPALRLALGLYDLYNTTSWLSDILSYSRLLALGLATGVIASVINAMGVMGGKTVFGVILFIIVFFIGHTFNLAINLLGAYVHTNRLQFVEFFGKFYEGGGREFSPFTTNTKYVKFASPKEVEEPKQKKVTQSKKIQNQKNKV